MRLTWPAVVVKVKSSLAVIEEILEHAIPYAPLDPTALMSGEIKA